jgi:hypothetical protein
MRVKDLIKALKPYEEGNQFVCGISADESYRVATEVTLEKVDYFNTSVPGERFYILISFRGTLRREEESNANGK